MHRLPGDAGDHCLRFIQSLTHSAKVETIKYKFANNAECHNQGSDYSKPVQG
jgi:hypothetical protein